MERGSTLLLVHTPGAFWEDLATELRSLPASVQVVTSLVEAELWVSNLRPDVVLLDDRFSHGIDLLLHTRNTATGISFITLRKLEGPERLYDATLAGDQPTYLAPAPPRPLVRLLKQYLGPRSR